MVEALFFPIPLWPLTSALGRRAKGQESSTGTCERKGTLKLFAKRGPNRYLWVLLRKNFPGPTLALPSCRRFFAPRSRRQGGAHK
jgi:hypothetical protein